jgi:hypothetical protein
VMSVAANAVLVFMVCSRLRVMNVLLGLIDRVAGSMEVSTACPQTSGSASKYERSADGPTP